MAGWLYVAAGVLDVLDGRLARATNQQSKAGAFLDSVTDRWGELLVFAGCAWFLRDMVWLLAALAAMIGSVMVSYTRARGEGLGIRLSGGVMQRCGRMILVATGTLIAAWFHPAVDLGRNGSAVMGTALLLCGVGSIGTAISRWVRGYRLLRAGEHLYHEPLGSYGLPYGQRSPVGGDDLFDPVRLTRRESAELDA
jgi:phosphatidylglycerophosphate synthase